MREDGLTKVQRAVKVLERLPRWLILGLAFPLLVLNGWVFLVVFHYFQSLITIFVTANLLAFILNYPVNLLTSRGAKRNRAILFVGLLAVLLILVLGLTLAPAVVGQFNELIARLPTWIESSSQQVQIFDRWAAGRKLPLNLTGLAIQLTERLAEQLQSLTGQVFNVIAITIGGVFNFVFILVMTFYLLLQGDRLWDGIFLWFPQPYGSLLRQLLRQNFHNYFIGQASLAAIMGTSMTIAFVLLQVPFALLFGLGVGFMALFPFGTGVSISAISLLMALKSVWLGLKVLGVAVVIQQIIENGIAPRLLGGFTGLNPVWILIALLIGAQVAGILGLLLAVPLAGFLKGVASLMRSHLLEEHSLESLK
ncbi:MAG: AI-2E family transporter [Hydrococcus sp. C42_A2020_068]|uniref:AI-2E family transporter n=1 Tax=Pleurocapsa sp. PCC 7327 TaxID=118163 RepID=UPI00029FB611|nr:AI-2E family transporter [Pleurocapsa sp. PCC 7327]AFY76114.1 putative permease [Pleurocapsa sp. PCC 7327]MBF2020525.1 AI-2E family transporter [Hydrococcus sp. C42_A2020_068]